jgi:polyhydroxybutyrate depolymerase
MFKLFIYYNVKSKKTMRLLTFFTLSVLSISSCQKSTIAPLPIEIVNKASEQKTVTLTIDGVLRTFIMYLPTGYNNAGKMPIIFALHGGGGAPESMYQLADFRPIAERDKVIIVCPAGIQTSWNDGRPTSANTAGINDVSFISQLCSYMVTNYAADATRIYATGMSNGGFMTSRLACELSDKIAAIASVAASMEQNAIAANCNTNGRAVPAIYIHGTLDPLVPFLGGTMSPSTSGGVILSHAQVIAKWVTINNCVTPVVTTDVPDIANDGTTIKQRVYGGGNNGSEVVSYVVANGGHTWPQGFQYISEAIIGKTSQDMNACEVIWQFFKRFKR